MIQRVQSVFLLIVAVLSLLLIYIPVYEQVNIINPEAPGTRIGITQSSVLVIINAVIGILAFINIFLFKVRNVQIRLCNLGLLVTCIFVALLFFMADSMSTKEDRIQYLAGTYIPLLQLLFLFLASFFIRKDEKLVRSADRLR